MGSDTLYTQFDSVFFEKTRLSMMTILYREKRASFKRIKTIVGGTDGAIYTHLQKLQDAGYIEPAKEIIGSKVQTFYSLTKEGKKLFQKYISFMESMIRVDETADSR